MAARPQSKDLAHLQPAGRLVGGGLVPSRAPRAAGGGALGAIAGGLICYAQDGVTRMAMAFSTAVTVARTPRQYTVDHMGCPLPQYPAAQPQPAAASEVITLDDHGAVLFAFDSADDAGAQQRLQGLPPKLNTGRGQGQVIGHTDSVGSDSYNQACPNAAPAASPST
jgi:outer membrane protein OmpA-like peptidoglycan-associated protein